MTGSKTNLMTRDQVLAAINAISPSQDFVWDGVNEDEKPATKEELKTAPSRRQRLEADKTPILFQENCVASFPCIRSRLAKPNE